MAHRNILVDETSIKTVKIKDNKNILSALARRNPLVVGVYGLFHQLDAASVAFQKMFQFQKQHDTSFRGVYKVPRAEDARRAVALRAILSETSTILLMSTTLNWTGARAHPIWRVDRYRILVWDAIADWFHENNIDVSKKWSWVERFTSNLSRDRLDIINNDNFRIAHLRAAEVLSKKFSNYSVVTGLRHRGGCDASYIS